MFESLDEDDDRREEDNLNVTIGTVFSATADCVLRAFDFKKNHVEILKDVPMIIVAEESYEFIALCGSEVVRIRKGWLREQRRCPVDLSFH